MRESPKGCRQLCSTSSRSCRDQFGNTDKKINHTAETSRGIERERLLVLNSEIDKQAAELQQISWETWCPWTNRVK